MPANNPIIIDYSDTQLKVLVEEYITQQRGTFTFKGVCSYVLYWAIEEGRTTDSQNTLFASNHLHPTACERISRILRKISQEYRITIDSGDKPTLTSTFDKNALFTKAL